MSIQSIRAQLATLKASIPPKLPRVEIYFYSQRHEGDVDNTTHLFYSTPEERDARIVKDWERKAEDAETGLERSVYRALVMAASAAIRKHGRLVGGASLKAETFLPIVKYDR